MDKFIVLLPLYYNDGSLVPSEMIQDAIEDLYKLSGGYTIEGEVKGAYRMKNGQKQEDTLLKVAVMIPPESANDLRAIVRRLCIRFQQECIWLEKSNSTIELVEP